MRGNRGEEGGRGGKSGLAVLCSVNSPAEMTLGLLLGLLADLLVLCGGRETSAVAAASHTLARSSLASPLMEVSSNLKNAGDGVSESFAIGSCVADQGHPRIGS